MSPIQTAYKGCRFRSRTEARWAVFFDALGIRWEYEPEGFEFADGTRYLPDFWLPGFHSVQGEMGNIFSGTYVEVKGLNGEPPQSFVDRAEDQHLALGSFTKGWKLSAEGSVQVLCLWGQPRQETFVLLTPWAPGHVDRQPVQFQTKYLPGGRNAREHRLYTYPEQNPLPDDGVARAVDAARGARFEFGESGAAV